MVNHMTTSSWHVRWTDNLGHETTMTLHNKTKEEAIVVVTAFGWTPRSWWHWNRMEDFFEELLPKDK